MDATDSDVHNSNNVSQAPKVYCICRTSSCDGFMICCDNCGEWFHEDCTGINEEQSEKIDIYSCILCEANNPELRTTYKLNYGKKRQSNKGQKIAKSMVTQRIEENTEAAVNCITVQEMASTANSELGFVDTTIRKAKTDAYERFKSSSLSSVPLLKEKKPKKKSKAANYQPIQCYGPGCTKASRKGSKYCSDDCGIALGKNRILEILPQRLEQLNTPSVANELNRKRLNDIRVQLDKIEEEFEKTDIDIVKLIDQIQQGKKPGNSFVEEQCDNTSLIDCMLCGMEIQNRMIERHLELCYRKAESKIFITEYTNKPNDVRWNVFCNRRISKNLYCKKMRVLCPQHYKDYRKDDEVCGYRIGIIDGIPKYCGNIGRTCKHCNWEDRLRAELDLKKLNLLLKYNKLEKEKEEIRKAMCSRGNLMALLLHQTIQH